MKSPYIEEKLTAELEEALFRSLYESFFLEGGTLPLLIEHVWQKNLHTLSAELELLSQALDEDFEKKYLNLRRSLFEAKKLFTLQMEYAKKIHAVDLPTGQQAEAAILFCDNLLTRSLAFLPKVQKLRQRLFHPLANSLEQIESSLHAIIFQEFQKKIIHLMEFQMASLVFSKILKELKQAILCIETHRQDWDAIVLEKARSIYITPKDCPYPLIYTPEGKIYNVPIHVEHCIGFGSGKYAARTFELEGGSLHALIRPRTKDRYIEGSQNEEAFALSNSRKIWQEAKLLKKLQGAEGIIQLHELFVFPIGNKLEFFEIMELIEGDNLSALASSKILSEQDKMQIAQDLLSGLVSLSEKGIIHRDIKTENVLIDFSHSSAKAKIIDFNLACEIDDSIKKSKAQFNAFYCAPEYAQALIAQDLQDSEQLTSVMTPKLDVWAIGCLLYQLLLDGHLPWLDIEITPPDMDGWTESEKKKQELSEIYTYQKKMLSMISSLPETWLDTQHDKHPLYPLIASMLSTNPEKRISSQEALSCFLRISKK